MKKLLLTLVVALAIASTPRAQADQASHAKAVETLMTTMGMSELFTNVVDQMLDAQIKQNPQLAPLKDVMKTFFSKYMSWNAIKDDMVKLYMDTFTEDEINAVIKFYQTPAGQKMAKVTPTLSAKASQIGQEKVQAHLPELQAMIQEVMAKKAGAK